MGKADGVGSCKILWIIRYKLSSVLERVYNVITTFVNKLFAAIIKVQDSIDYAVLCGLN
jgi:hypothetical protein